METKHGQIRRGFTLIELLVVIAVIALLAGMIFPVTNVVTRNKIRSKARTELVQVEMFIEAYKSKLGYYPPGNPTNLAITPLYYELAGTSRQAPNANFETLDKSSTISAAELTAAFGVSGLMNTMIGAGSDEGALAQRFIVGTRPVPTATIVAGADPSSSPKVLVTSVGWKNENTPLIASNPKASPFFYNAANPTNNPSTYDLWVDVIVGDKTNRICNWSKEPIVLQ